MLTTVEPGTSSADVWMVSPRDLPALWPQISAFLYSDPQWTDIYDPTDLYVAIIHSQNHQLWVALDAGNIEGIMITCIVPHAKRSYMHILGITCKGNLMKYLYKGLDRIEKFACLMGIYELVIDGRKGWQRLLKKRNYTASLQLRKNVQTLWS